MLLNLSLVFPWWLEQGHGGYATDTLDLEDYLSTERLIERVLTPF